MMVTKNHIMVFRSCRTRRRGGFTLIEILVVTAIVGLVVAAVASCITAGLRVWEAAQSINIVERESYVAFETVKRDLMNSFPVHGVRFEGNSGGVAFPGALKVKAADLKGWEERVGRVEYSFDPQRKVLVRKEQGFPYQGQPLLSSEIVAGNVMGLRFQYMGMAGSGQGAWMETWTDPTNHPAAVKFELLMSGARGPLSMERTIVLPECGRLQQIQARK
jgi:prepilin-type N-terminal cleavage/methylation domain-containing protein